MKTFKAVPNLDIPEWNNFRTKLIEKAIELEIPIGPRETIDFHNLFETIKEVYRVKT